MQSREKDGTAGPVTVCQPLSYCNFRLLQTNGTGSRLHIATARKKREDTPQHPQNQPNLHKKKEAHTHTHTQKKNLVPYEHINRLVYILLI